MRDRRDGLRLRQVVEVQRKVIQIDRQVCDERKIGAQFGYHLIALLKQHQVELRDLRVV